MKRVDVFFWLRTCTGIFTQGQDIRARPAIMKEEEPIFLASALDSSSEMKKQQRMLESLTHG